MTVIAHIINSKWKTESYVLSTFEMEERHTAINLANELKSKNP